MTNHLFAIAILGILFSSCKGGDQKDPASSGPIADSSMAGPQQLSDPYFFKTLEGTIADKAVVMNIVKAGDRLNANYYYQEKGQPIFLTRNWEKTGGDSIYLLEVSTRTTEQSPTLALSISGEGLVGRWTSGDGKQSYPIVLKEPERKDSLQLVAIGKIDSAQYLKFKTDTPTLKTSVTVIAAAGSTEPASWLNSQIKNIIDNERTKSQDLSLRETIESLVRQDVEGYAKEVDSSLVGVDDDGPHYFLNREYETSSNLIYNNKGLLSLSMFNYAYTGGAHGNYGTAMYCFDLTQHKRLQLSDILTADSLVMERLLEQNYRKQYGLAASTPLDQRLFVKTLKPNNNFYLSPAGIGFVYSPYEIASYADGEINVWIPFSELKPYLNPAYLQRITP